MTAARKTLGVSRAADASRPDIATFNVTGARLERLKERAREMRRHPTEARQALWAEMSGSKLGGVKFTRQAVVGSSVVDFACPSRWIVVSLSSEAGNPDVDALQDKKLADVGIRVLRFAESEVLSGIDGVVREINAELNKPFARPRIRKQTALRIEGVEG